MFVNFLSIVHRPSAICNDVLFAYEIKARWHVRLCWVLHIVLVYFFIKDSVYLSVDYIT